MKDNNIPLLPRPKYGPVLMVGDSRRGMSGRQRLFAQGRMVPQTT